MEDKNNMSKLRQTAAGGGRFLSLIALAIILLGCTAPAHAADDNTVSIEVDQNAALQPTGTLYKATTNVTVKTGKPYGFNLTMQADTADLLNSKDPTHKISATPSSTPVALNANQWGYSLSKSAATFSAVPAAQATPAVIADVTKAKPVGCTNPANCTKSVTFAANVDPVKLASGSYSTTITYTATAKPAPKPTYTDWPQRKTKTDPSDVCRSGDANSSCLVDLDKNMIPVKYTGTTTNAQWTSIANPEDEDAKGNWYDYGKKQWANAVTVKKEALSKYQGKDSVVDQADILGYWVYIPRYTYEVMRRDCTDKPVKEQNFDIKFENTKTPKKRPLACKTGNDKDYRTECNVSRELPLTGGEVSTWATHPAFTFGTKELNGIWFAKFETTGTTSQPTVLPNEAHISGEYSGMNNEVGNFYALAKTLGINDLNNVGSSGFTTTQNNHYLARLSSHMVNNNDWGAVTYLSSSKYGAGYNKVQINSSAAKHTTYGDTYSITGCGPWEDGDTSSYGNSNDWWIGHKGIGVGSLGTQQACSTDNPRRAYNGSIGKLASTTNNVYGIYDMSGGGSEYVAASYTSDVNLHDSSTSYFSQPANPPYVNNYSFDDLNECTFKTCGGQALYETNDGSGKGGTQWNGNYMYFATSFDPWFSRGGGCRDDSKAGLLYALGYHGHAYYDYAFRVALAPTATAQN